MRAAFGEGQPGASPSVKAALFGVSPLLNVLPLSFLRLPQRKMSHLVIKYLVYGSIRL